MLNCSPRLLDADGGFSARHPRKGVVEGSLLVRMIDNVDRSTSAGNRPARVDDSKTVQVSLVLQRIARWVVGRERVGFMWSSY